MDVFTAIADPTRRELLRALSAGPQTVNELAAASGALQPSVSKHLKALLEAGLVTRSVEGPRRIYALAPDGLTELDDWLVRLRTQWTDRLDALEAHLGRSDTP